MMENGGLKWEILWIAADSVSSSSSLSHVRFVDQTDCVGLRTVCPDRQFSERAKVAKVEFVVLRGDDDGTVHMAPYSSIKAAITSGTSSLFSSHFSSRIERI